MRKNTHCGVFVKTVEERFSRLFAGCPSRLGIGHTIEGLGKANDARAAPVKTLGMASILA